MLRYARLLHYLIGVLRIRISAYVNKSELAYAYEDGGSTLNGPALPQTIIRQENGTLQS